MYLFQPPRTAAGEYLHSHLHSTMYLFQLNPFNHQEPFNLHLHSTMYLFQLTIRNNTNHIHYIYIPLCIYFNLVLITSSFAASVFTFHYVSISTGIMNTEVRREWQFTFHYVSISTNTCQCDFFCSPVFTFHYVSISTFAYSADA